MTIDIKMFSLFMKNGIGSNMKCSLAIIKDNGGFRTNHMEVVEKVSKPLEFTSGGS